MIAVTLNSKKGLNLGIIPSTQINTYLINSTTVAVNASAFPTFANNNTIVLGDTFTHGGNVYTFNNNTTLASYTFTPNLITAINNAALYFPITTTHSATLGFKICAGTVNGTIPIGSSVISFTGPHLITCLNVISPNSSLVIGSDTYSIEKISYSSVASANMIRITPPLKTATISSGNSTLITIYSKSFNTMSYNIDTSIFEDGKKYELSFSFTSSPCIINQCYQPASVYVDWGNTAYESGTNSINTTTKLGLLKNNYVHQNMNSAQFGNVSYSTLIADDSNKPLIINKPIRNTITVNIMNDDLELWSDNSNVGLCPPYEITFHFKEISV